LKFLFFESIFDRQWASLLASTHGNGGPDPAKTQSYFVTTGQYTAAGTATHYRRSFLTGEDTYQNLAEGFIIGKRFHSALVIRLADAKPAHLGHVIKADGRFRIFAFAGMDDRSAAGSAIRQLCEFLVEDKDSPIREYTRREEDIDAVIDVRAVFQQAHRQLAIEAMPPLLLPHKGRYGLQDYEKIFCANDERDSDIFAMCGIDRAWAA
jgi:phenol 2-monooxygenase (NADPH)